MENAEIIERFKKMKTIGEMCRENKINYSNLVNKRTSKENEQIIVNEILTEISTFVLDFLVARWKNVNKTNSL